MVETINISPVQNSPSRVVPRSEAVVVSAEAAKKPPSSFVSSSIRMDNLQNVAILEYRSEAGEIVQQYPTQAQIEAFRRAERLQTGQQQTETAPQVTESTESHEQVAVKAPVVRETQAAPVVHSGGGTESKHSVEV